tara:strand:+ start:10152 stop:10577 length:426 start_codon:yes stop_codon:yes gene_type:complete
MDMLLQAVALENITQEDIDEAVRIVTDREWTVLVVGEVYGTRVHAGPPDYAYNHDRVYGVLIEDEVDGIVAFRYVLDRCITQGPLRGTQPDVVIDTVMEAGGPGPCDWTVKDVTRSSKLEYGDDHEFFVDVGDDESVTFCA